MRLEIDMNFGYKPDRYRSHANGRRPSSTAVVSSQNYKKPPQRRGTSTINNLPGMIGLKAMPLVQLASFQLVPDPTGMLSIYETGKGIDFIIKRVYCLSNLDPASSRGFHAHRNLRQVAVCVSGSCRFVLDDGERREEVVLDSPGIGLQISSMVWREMHDFSPDCVLMVLASELYSEQDYLRDYDEFKVEAQKLPRQ